MSNERHKATGTELSHLGACLSFAHLTANSDIATSWIYLSALHPRTPQAYVRDACGSCHLNTDRWRHRFRVNAGTKRQARLIT